MQPSFYSSSNPIAFKICREEIVGSRRHSQTIRRSFCIVIQRFRPQRLKFSAVLLNNFFYIFSTALFDILLLLGYKSPDLNPIENLWYVLDSKLPSDKRKKI